MAIPTLIRGTISRDAGPEAVAPERGWAAVAHDARSRPYVLGRTFDARPGGARDKLIAMAAELCREGVSYWSSFPLDGGRGAQFRWLGRRGYKVRPAEVQAVG